MVGVSKQQQYQTPKKKKVKLKLCKTRKASVKRSLSTRKYHTKTVLLSKIDFFKFLCCMLLLLCFGCCCCCDCCWMLMPISSSFFSFLFIFIFITHLPPFYYCPFSFPLIFWSFQKGRKITLYEIMKLFLSCGTLFFSFCFLYFYPEKLFNFPFFTNVYLNTLLEHWLS